VTLPTEPLEMRKCPLTLSLAKPGQNTEAILKTYEQFNHGDIHTIITSFCIKKKAQNSNN
jgi:hypothetical protein